MHPSTPMHQHGQQQPIGTENFLVLETPSTSRSSSIAVPATPDPLAPAAGEEGEILDTKAPPELAARVASACDVLSYLGSKGEPHCLTAEFKIHLHCTLGWDPDSYYLERRASLTSPSKVLEAGDMLTGGDGVRVHWRLRGGAGGVGDKLWHVDWPLLYDCRERVEKLLEVARTNSRQRGFGLNEVDKVAGVDRCNDLFTFGGHVVGAFKDFLEGESFVAGGYRLSRANVLSLTEDEALFRLAADAAKFFGLGDALPVLAQVVDESAGYKLPRHHDKRVWDTAVSVTLKGSAEWHIGSDVVLVRSGTAWAISDHGEHVYPYDTPHGHSETTTRRLAVVLRYKFPRGHEPVSPDAAASETADPESDEDPYVEAADEDFHNMVAASCCNNNAAEEPQPLTMEDDGVEFVCCVSGPGNESTCLPTRQLSEELTPGVGGQSCRTEASAVISMNTPNAESNTLVSYTMDVLRGKACAFMDDRTNHLADFDDLAEAMDVFFGDLDPGATACSSCCFGLG